MIEDLKNLPPEFQNAFHKRLLEMIALGILTETRWPPLTPEQIQQKEWDTRMSNMKAGKSGLDTRKIHVGKAA